MSNFELFNGETILSGDSFLNSSNRAFKYGDGLFETIKVSRNVPQFLKDHFERLLGGMNLLHINCPADFTEIFLRQQIDKILSLNETHNARLRLVVFRNSSGYYTPLQDDMSWHLSCEALTEEFHSLSPPGLTAGIYEDNYKESGPLSSVKTLNGLIYVLAGIVARQSGLDEMLITNRHGNILESISSNIFIRKDNSFITPPLSDGCLDGVMRKNVIGILKLQKIELMEQSLTEIDLLGADEILLTNVIRGVQWVKTVGSKNFEQKFAFRINEWLNQDIS